MGTPRPNPDVTHCLELVSRGDQAAARELLPLVYQELRALAQSYLRERGGERSLNATAIVHEAFLRLAGSPAGGWEGRGHFFAVAAKAMRQIVVDHVRARRTAKRGRRCGRVALEGLISPDEAVEIDLLDLHECLTRLAALDPLQTQIVELRFFAGLTVDEVAKVIGSSKATIEREWRTARAWLGAELRKDRSDDA
ncbi:MAG: sigma-70 family RNA polymerase sigma factor [Phycisphaerae bacterium]|nr:sigma-70 family RNA polymerase sigma factor [Phycisphaerae bacterium]